MIPLLLSHVRRWVVRHMDWRAKELLQKNQAHVMSHASFTEIGPTDKTCVVIIMKD